MALVPDDGLADEDKAQDRKVTHRRDHHRQIKVT